MIDPKMLELSRSMTASPICCRPVVTDPKKAVVALKWVVAEMEERYRKMSQAWACATSMVTTPGSATRIKTGE